MNAGGGKFSWGCEGGRVDGRSYRGRGIGGAGGTKRRRPSGDNTTNSGEKKQRKCGLCHEPGHVRTKCPMKDKSGASGWN